MPRCLLLLLLILVASGSVLAQTTGELPPRKEIDARIERLRASKDDKDAARAAKAYEEALQWLAASTDQDTRRKALTQRLRSTDQGLANFRRESQLLTQAGAPRLDNLSDETLTTNQTRLLELQNRKTALQQEATAVATERRTAPQRMVAAQKELRELTTATARPAEATAIGAAIRVRQLAQEQALRSELGLLKAQIAGHSRLDQLIEAERELIAKQTKRQQKIVRLLNQRRARDRGEQAKVARDQAKKLQQRATAVHPRLQELCKRNVELTDAWLTLAGQLAATGQLEQGARAALSRLERDEASARKRIALVGLTEAIGHLLRQHRVRLPDLQDEKSRSKERSRELAELDVALLDWDEEQEALSDLPTRAQQLSQDLGLGDATQKNAAESIAFDVLTQRHRFLDSVRGVGKELTEALVTLDTTRKQLISRGTAYREFIDENGLWIRNLRPVWSSALLPRVAKGLVGSADWGSTIGDLGTSLLQTIGRVIPAAALLLCLVLLRGRFRRGFVQAAAEARDPGPYRFTPVAKASLATVLLAALLPTLTGLLLAPAMVNASGNEVLRAIGAALVPCSISLFFLLLVRRSMLPDGLGVAHFQWPPAACARVVTAINILLLLGLPAILLFHTLDAWSGDALEGPTSRFAFVFAQVAMVLALRHGLHRRHGVLGVLHQQGNDSFLIRHRVALLLFVVILPLSLIILALLGFGFAARALAEDLYATLALIVLFILGQALALRGLLSAKTHLANRERNRRRTGDAATHPGETLVTDVQMVDQQTRQLLRAVLGITLLAALWLVWADNLPAFGVLRQIELWQTTQTAPPPIAGVIGASPTASEITVWITLADLLAAVLVLLATWFATRNIPGLLTLLVLQRTSLQPGQRYAVATLARYVLTLVGLIIAFNLIGVGWSKVQWLAAAITLGLGFGLQEIIANFVSGLIILFEQPIRVGDIVVVGGIEGRVTRIQIRATTIQDWDRRELIIPNKDFITSQVVNWTLTDGLNRIVLKVGIAYGSDVEKARGIILDCAAKQNRVLTQPKPKVIFRRFGDSSLDFEVRVFIADRDHWPKVIDGMHSSIDAAFREAGIEIAFPQRDLHVRSMKAELPKSWRTRTPASDAEADAG